MTLNFYLILLLDYVIGALQKILSNTSEPETKTGVEEYNNIINSYLFRLILLIEHFIFQINKRA